ncbi:MAG: nitrate/nitrite transporter NrtS [Oscillatoriales cyanobacterium RM2_1_1]|nr:nitrate/nitrite transporter NrtS [Oscillatoriales cyanobacterium SM2_3_0]NJO45602.1 nitrate/nitrite transporter NrtS [Oscillatoriales cyanobacterium RM2_1_1]
MQSVNGFLMALTDKKLMPTALKIALVVGSILFLINHGTALIRGKMTRDRWISSLLTYCIPYMVNIHGQCIIRQRSL